MEKKTKIIVVVVAAVIIVVSVSLFFLAFQANQANSDKSRFIGTWEYKSEITNQTVRYSYYENNTMKQAYIVDGNESMVYWYSYELNGNTIYYKEIGGYEHSNSVRYSFSNNYENLTIESLQYPGFPETLIKISNTD